jgi:hypothetical protein
MATIYEQAANTDLNSPVAAAQAQRGQLKSLFGDQRTETGDFLTGLRGFVSNSPTQAMMAERIGNEIGLPNARANALSLNQTLFNIPATYSKATRGFDVNNNQLQRIIGQKQSEIAPSAALATQNQAALEGQLGQRLGYEQQDFANRLIPYQSEQSLLTDRLARETTGYTNQMQSELDALIARMNAGVTLSEGEKQRANALAIAEKNYQTQLKIAEMNIASNEKTSKQSNLIALAKAFSG